MSIDVIIYTKMKSIQECFNKQQ